MSTSVYQMKPCVRASTITYQPKASTTQARIPAGGSQRERGRRRRASVIPAASATIGATAPSGSLASPAAPKAASPPTTHGRRPPSSPASASAKPQASAATKSVSGRT